MLIGEAPGRRGAERTGMPFHGDLSGQRFERFLATAGWTRADVFVTNAVLCNPQRPDGRNRPPTAAEVRNCRDHLAATIQAVNPTVVVGLGRRALAALDAVHAHTLIPSAGAQPGQLRPWFEQRWLGWMLHPSPLTQTQRSTAEQEVDWRRLRAEVDRVQAVDAWSDMPTS
jgi:DNA polymerase